MIDLQKVIRRVGGSEYSDSFAGYHPLVNMLYFTAVIGFAMFFTHPVCLAISLVNAYTYSIYISGRKALRFSLLYMLPMLLMTALLNPAFNHQGGTILTYLPSGNPLTLESIIYGFSTSVMLITGSAEIRNINLPITCQQH